MQESWQMPKSYFVKLHTFSFKKKEKILITNTKYWYSKTAYRISETNHEIYVWWWNMKCIPLKIKNMSNTYVPRIREIFQEVDNGDCWVMRCLDNFFPLIISIL